MAKTVDQIREQIARLQEQEKALLQKEVVGVVERIKAAVAHYGITAEQIFGTSAEAKPGGRKSAVTGKPAARAAKAVKPKKVAAKRLADSPVEGAAEADASNKFGKGVKLAVKFRDGDNTWSGRGSQPRWLRAALEAGKKAEDFLVA